jgi:hypothetical protein
MIYITLLFILLLGITILVKCDNKNSNKNIKSSFNIKINDNKKKINKNNNNKDKDINNNDNNNDYPSLKSKDFMLAGGIATACTDVLLFPLDTIKVTQQSSRTPLSFIDTYKGILNSKGPKGFFKGSFSYSITDGLGSALFFSMYEASKSIASKYLSGPQLGASSFLCSSIAYVGSSCALVPAEDIKTRMQTGGYNDIFHCIQDSVLKFDLKSHKYIFNPFGLYTGYAATLGRDLPYFALQLGFYGNIRNLILEQVQNRISDPKKREKLTSSGALDLAAGISSGLLTAILTNPMDVAAARLITQSKSGMTLGSIPYKGFIDCMIRMAKEEGPKAFFIGSKARVSNIAPFCAISLTINESLKRILENRNKKNK